MATSVVACCVSYDNYVILLPSYSAIFSNYSREEDEENFGILPNLEVTQTQIRRTQDEIHLMGSVGDDSKYEDSRPRTNRERQSETTFSVRFRDDTALMPTIDDRYPQDLINVNNDGNGITWIEGFRDTSKHSSESAKKELDNIEKEENEATDEEIDMCIADTQEQIISNESGSCIMRTRSCDYGECSVNSQDTSTDSRGLWRKTSVFSAVPPTLIDESISTEMTTPVILLPSDSLFPPSFVFQNSAESLFTNLSPTETQIILIDDPESDAFLGCGAAVEKIERQLSSTNFAPLMAANGVVQYGDQPKILISSNCGTRTASSIGFMPLDDQVETSSVRCFDEYAHSNPSGKPLLVSSIDIISNCRGCCLTYFD